MRERQCCGVHTFQDFAQSNVWIRHKASASIVVPESCCKRQTDSDDGMVLVDSKCPYEPTAENSNYKQVRFLMLIITFLCHHLKSVLVFNVRIYHNLQGCFEALAHWINSKHQLIVIASLVVVSIEVFLVFLACCLWSSIRSYEDIDL